MWNSSNTHSTHCFKLLGIAKKSQIHICSLHGKYTSVSATMKTHSVGTVWILSPAKLARLQVVLLWGSNPASPCGGNSGENRFSTCCIGNWIARLVPSTCTPAAACTSWCCGCCGYKHRCCWHRNGTTNRHWRRGLTGRESSRFRNAQSADGPSLCQRVWSFDQRSGPCARLIGTTYTGTRLQHRGHFPQHFLVDHIGSAWWTGLWRFAQ